MSGVFEYIGMIVFVFVAALALGALFVGGLGLAMRWRGGVGAWAYLLLVWAGIPALFYIVT